MLKRKILDSLISWKSSPNKVALLVKGARQVGKTTSIRDFGKKFYKSFIEINFERNPKFIKAFDGDLDARTIILNLSSMGLGPFIKNETLIFFDEIQSCPAARTSIKFLVEDGQYDYIESGSLLGINYSDVSSFPVGFEEQIQMFPLDFEEFLWANGVSNEIVEVLSQSFMSLKPAPSFIHNQIMEHFKRYMIVGGMPRVVETFLSNSDLSQTLRAQQIILSNYRDDISKYAGQNKTKVKSIFDSIPEQLSKEKKRFFFNLADKNAYFSRYDEATSWLIDAGIANYCINVSSMELPFSFFEKRNMFKLYMADTGLLCRMAMNGIQNSLLQGDIYINKGAITENVVSSILSSNGKPLYYYDKKSRQELDFLINENNAITIIEVKSGKDYKSHSSLDSALNLEKLALESKGKPYINRAIVLSENNVESQGKIVYLPIYMAIFL